MTFRKEKTDLERFTEKYRIDESGCWRWTASKNHAGYGRFFITPPRRTVSAHRWSYEHFVQPIPDRFTIDHLCQVRDCVNPAHLEAVSGKVNILRGAGRAARNSKRQSCIRGHPLSGDNLYVTATGRRQCKRCRREWTSKWRAENPEKDRENNRRYMRSEQRRQYRREYYRRNLEQQRAYQREYKRRKQQERAS